MDFTKPSTSANSKVILTKLINCILIEDSYKHYKDCEIRSSLSNLGWIVTNHRGNSYSVSEQNVKGFSDNLTNLYDELVLAYS